MMTERNELKYNDMFDGVYENCIYTYVETVNDLYENGTPKLCNLYCIIRYKIYISTAVILIFNNIYMITALTECRYNRTIDHIKQYTTH